MYGRPREIKSLFLMAMTIAMQQRWSMPRDFLTKADQQHLSSLYLELLVKPLNTEWGGFTVSCA